MKLRNGKQYILVKPIEINKVVIIQSITRGYIIRTQFYKLLRAIRLIHKQASHLYKYKPKKKLIKPTYLAPLVKLEKTAEIEEIANQYNSIINLGRTFNRRGIYKSTRNIPNVKITDINHFSAADLAKYKKIIFTETSIKELEKRFEK